MAIPMTDQPVCVSSASSVKRRCRLHKRTSLTKAGSRFVQTGRQRSSGWRRHAGDGRALLVEQRLGCGPWPLGGGQKKMCLSLGLGRRTWAVGGGRWGLGRSGWRKGCKNSEL